MARSDSSSISSDGGHLVGDAANNKAVSPEILPSDASSSSNSEESQRGRSGPLRPRLTSRKSSGTIIVPRNHVTAEEEVEYPPDDARAMSPRRNSQETEAIEEATRYAVREYVSTSRPFVLNQY